MNFLTDRQPPHLPDHECSILAACLILPDVVGEIVDELTPEVFYSRTNQGVFRAIAHLHRSGQPIDINCVRARLDDEKVPGYSEVSTHLAKLTDWPLPSSNGYYCRKLREAFALRQTIVAANAIMSECYDGGEADKIIDNAQRKIMDISVDVPTPAEGFGDLCDVAVDRYEDLYRNRGKLSGVPTGYHMLDQYTCGLQPANLIVVAARPSMGKSALAMSMTLHQAAKGIPVGWFPLEQSKAELIDRAVSSVSKINLNKFRSGYFSDGDWERIVSVIDRVGKLPICIDDSEGLHFSEIRSRARKMVKKHGCKIFYIDHLQLVHGDGTQRDREIGSITAGLKGMSKELNVPVVLISQLNRGLENRPNKRPLMSDLRDSGNIEQDSDIIMFLYRRAVYNDWDGFSFGDSQFVKEPYNLTGDLKQAFESDAELNIAKQRNGPIGGTKLFWNAKTTTFYDAQGG